MNKGTVTRPSVMSSIIAVTMFAVVQNAAVDGPHGQDTQCIYWGDMGSPTPLDSRGLWDSCMGTSVGNCTGQWCEVVGNLSYGNYCSSCNQQEGCSSCWGDVVQGYVGDGACTHDSGPDACYCRYDYYVPINMYCCNG